MSERIWKFQIGHWLEMNFYNGQTFRIPRSDALPLSHSNSTVDEVYYDTRSAYC